MNIIILGRMRIFRSSETLSQTIQKLKEKIVEVATRYDGDTQFDPDSIQLVHIESAQVVGDASMVVLVSGHGNISRARVVVEEVIRPFMREKVGHDAIQFVLS